MQRSSSVSTIYLSCLLFRTWKASFIVLNYVTSVIVFHLIYCVNNKYQYWLKDWHVYLLSMADHLVSEINLTDALRTF